MSSATAVGKQPPWRRQRIGDDGATNRRHGRVGAEHEAIATSRRQRCFQAEQRGASPAGRQGADLARGLPTWKDEATEDDGCPEVHVHAGAVLLRRSAGQDLDVDGQST